MTSDWDAFATLQYDLVRDADPETVAQVRQQWMEQAGTAAPSEFSWCERCRRAYPWPELGLANIGWGIWLLVCPTAGCGGAGATLKSYATLRARHPDWPEEPPAGSEWPPPP